MPIFIIGLLLILNSMHSEARTIEEAQMIYQKILKANKMQGPSLHMYKSEDINAHYGWGGIFINVGMLRYARNQSEIALVIGHELAHYTLKHWRSNPANEFAADKLGSYYMSNSGYNVCKGAKLFKRFDDKASKTHPSARERYRRLCH